MMCTGELLNKPNCSGKNINPGVFYNESSKRTFTYSVIISVIAATQFLKNNSLHRNE